MATQRNRTFLIALALLLVAGVALIGYMMTRPAAVTAVVESAAPASASAAAPAAAPAAQGYAMGSDSAPVEIVEYADFECPACGQFARVTEPDVRTRLVQTGLARFRFMDTPNVGTHPAAMFAHDAAACANAQGKFWPMHDRIFAGQLEWSTVLNGKDMNAPRVMRRYAEEIGLDKTAYDACFASKQFEPQIMANLAEAIRIQVPSTPTIVVGKRMVPGPPYDVIKALVDSATRESGRK